MPHYRLSKALSLVSPPRSNISINCSPTSKQDQEITIALDSILEGQSYQLAATDVMSQSNKDSESVDEFSNSSLLTRETIDGTAGSEVIGACTEANTGILNNGESIDSTERKLLNIYEVPDSDDSESEIVRISSSDISTLASAIPDKNIKTSKTRFQASTRKSSRTPSKRKFDNYIADKNL
ncbi:hypothetical protein B0O99DRAFT_695827 [Bisporella sp. PMI_857]|nr:hypothetical protein B0O99DRAFT_695827 [Bisporella sp. PMI_857]